MNETSADSFVNRNDPIPVVTISATEDAASSSQSHPEKRHHLRDKLSRSNLKIKKHDEDAAGSDAESGGSASTRTSLQDRLFTRLLQQIVPSEDLDDLGDSSDPRSTKYTNRPGFTLPLMTRNFRRFNSRIGVVFVFQARAIRLLSWHTPSHTLSFLAVYTFLCLDPSFLAVLPLAVILFFVMVPSFITRHPPPPTSSLTGTSTTAEAYSFTSRGPPLAPPASIKPVSEMSKDFIRNLRDLQNCMEDFSRIHDEVVRRAGPPTNFSNEPLSSALFLSLFASACILFLAAPLIPWRFAFLVAGWSATCLGHPSVQRAVISTHQEHFRPRERQASNWISAWIERDIEVDSAPELREVEIFELQRRIGHGAGTMADEWETWLFSPSPHDPLSQARVSGERPHGAAYFEDVQTPSGWGWSDKKWTLDLLSREWVEERMIVGVEVETEGERWVYDIAYDDDNEHEHEHDHSDTNYDYMQDHEHDHPEHEQSLQGSGKEADRVEEQQRRQRAKKLQKRHPQQQQQQQQQQRKRRDWEEGSGTGKRGQWRRRRWVRLVKRKAIST